MDPDTQSDQWDGIKARLVADFERDHQMSVFDSVAFRSARFAEYLAGRKMWWPHTETGRLALDDDTFKAMAKVYPEIEPLRQLRYSLAKMRLNQLAVGRDGRNRCMLSPFRARTSRSQPSNAAFIFGPAVWLRGFIKPEPGYGLAYVDWSQQEFGIAAALSGDRAMLAAYESGDPYLAFAKQAGAAPDDATAESHADIRSLFKACALAVQYGMGAESLANRIGTAKVVAQELLEAHRRTYARFWQWSDAALDAAMLTGKLETVFGWAIRVMNPKDSRVPALRNFPMQANGAEMLRLGCNLAVERGIKVCAPVHDALLIEAPVDQLEAAVATTQEAMADASDIVLDGFRLRSDAKTVQAPDRYMDQRGREMWDRVWSCVRVDHLVDIDV